MSRKRMNEMYCGFVVEFEPEQSNRLADHDL